MMNRAYIPTSILVSLTAMAVATASNVNAQEQSATASKPYSVGPTIEFSGGGTSFGIKGRISNPGIPISVRPIILFGYTPSARTVNFDRLVLNGVAINQAQLNILSANLIGFNTLSPEQQRISVKSAFSPLALTDRQADDISQQLNATNIQTGANGFTPGSGTAYGAAITYDFESADKKLMGYFGPRILFATGSSKVGNFDTSTNELSVGALIGADYAISGDLTAGLSATYNFSKSGTLSVSGPGGFSGSAPISGNSSFDIGVNFGYRF